jgi:signal transduction histidine kinase
MRFKLYARIWLAVVATIVAFTLVVGLFWQQHITHLRNEASEQAQREFEVRDKDQTVVGAAMRRMEPMAGPNVDPLSPRMRSFDIHLNNGQNLEVILPPRPVRPIPWYFSSTGFLGMLGLIAVAVALGAYPIVRRLTRRLEALQRGVELWGEGHLSVRVPLEGIDEVGFLAQKFNHAAEQVESLMATHKSLLANASHELRSPLARIRMAMALMEATQEPASETVKNEIKLNIQELDSLIEEILLASRLDSPEASIGKPESFDLMGLAAEECARTGAELVVTEDAHGTLEIFGYPRLVRRLLRNLLENAHRYNRPDKGAVSLSLALESRDKAQSDMIAISVNDHGPGVAIEESQRIFEPFYRAKNASERDGGVGLGLALVKTIAQRHGGSAVCMPIPSVGCCFVVKLAKG